MVKIRNQLRISDDKLCSTAQIWHQGEYCLASKNSWAPTSDLDSGDWVLSKSVLTCSDLTPGSWETAKLGCVVVGVPGKDHNSSGSSWAEQNRTARAELVNTWIHLHTGQAQWRVARKPYSSNSNIEMDILFAGIGNRFYFDTGQFIIEIYDSHNCFFSENIDD